MYKRGYMGRFFCGIDVKMRWRTAQDLSNYYVTSIDVPDTS